MILECPSCSSRFLVDSAMIPAEGRDVKCGSCGNTWFVRNERDVGELPGDDDGADSTGDTSYETNDEPLVSFAGSDADSAHDDAGSATHSDADMLADDDMRSGTLKGVSDDDLMMASSLANTKSEPITSKTPLLALAAVLFIGMCVSALLAYRDSLQTSLQPVYNLLGVHDTSGLALADVQLRTRPSRTKARFVVEGKIVNESDGVRHIPTLKVAVVDKMGEPIISREYEADETLKPGESYPFKAGNLETTFVDRVDHLVVDLGSDVQLMLRDQ